MDMIFFGFFGLLATIVAVIIGVAGYTIFFGRGKDMPNAGVRMRTRVTRHGILHRPGRLPRERPPKT